MNHINHSIPIVKSSGYKNHLNPIAPAPINLAPKPSPINLAPKPNQNNDSTSTITSLNSGATNLETQSLPCVITSKQWVLPPRPKAGRKPSEKQKKIQQNSQQAPNVSEIPMKSSQSSSNVSRLSKNLTGLNLYKSKSEAGDSKSTDTNLQNQLDSATEENLKLKDIISRLKQEIESLQTYGSKSTTSTVMHSPNYSNFTSEVSTPVNPSNFTSREVSPSTIDPTKIQQEHLVKRTKRQYRKKKPTKKEQAAIAAAAAAAATTQSTQAQTVQPIQPKEPLIKEETPSPISLHLESEVISDLPSIESIITSPNHNHKKPKTLKLERSMSLQPEHLDSGSHAFKSIGLDRTMSIPLEYGGGAISRTTTNNTSLFDICEQCGNENCLCLGRGYIDSLGMINEGNSNSAISSNNVNDNNNNEKNYDNEFDVSFYIKNEFDDDQFLMI